MKEQTRLLQQKIADMRQAGLSVNEIARRLNYTQGRISQLSDPSVKRKCRKWNSNYGRDNVD